MLEPPQGPASGAPDETPRDRPRETLRQRRRWEVHEKERLVREAAEPGNSIAAVARSVGIPASQLSAWKAQFLRKRAHSGALEDPGAGAPRKAGASIELWVKGELLLDDATTGQLQELGPGFAILRRNQLVLRVHDETVAQRYLAFLQRRGVDVRLTQA